MMMLSLLLLATTVVPYAIATQYYTQQPEKRSYKVFDRENWYEDHLDDTECLASPLSPQANNNNTKTSSLPMLFCPVPNPYSMTTPLYVKIGSSCGQEGGICCLVEEYECPGGELYCAECLDCLYPQVLHGSCCGVSEHACSEEEVCCKCGENSYKCLAPGEECTECPKEEEYSSPTPFVWSGDSTTPTPTPYHHVHQEL